MFGNKQIIKAVAYTAILVLLLVAALAWSGFRLGYVQKLLANEKVNTQTLEKQDEMSQSSIEELDKYLKEHDQTTDRKTRAQSSLRSSSQPRITDDKDGKDEARRRHDAWRSGVISVCPDCAPDKLEDQPAGRVEGVQVPPSTNPPSGGHGWRDGLEYEALFHRTGGVPPRLLG